MVEYEQQLRSLKPAHDFFIGIDSDGCVFDSMDLKHKECFCPAFINHMELQPVARMAREVWEFVNLYSRTRGINRYKALLRSMDVLSQRLSASGRTEVVDGLPQLREWIGRGGALGMATLIREKEQLNSAELERVHRWSVAVNDAVNSIVRGVVPFAGVQDCLERIAVKADAIVVSQATLESIENEWAEHQIDGYVQYIAGQEMGPKSDHLRFAAGGKYDQDKILMIGDAPGDHQAAEANQALFFPIIPGREAESWARLRDEGLDRFFAGTFAGEYQQTLEQEFYRALPEQTPW